MQSLSSSSAKSCFRYETFLCALLYVNFSLNALVLQQGGPKASNKTDFRAVAKAVAASMNCPGQIESMVGPLQEAWKEYRFEWVRIEVYWHCSGKLVVCDL